MEPQKKEGDKKAGGLSGVLKRWIEKLDKKMEKKAGKPRCCGGEDGVKGSSCCG